MINIKEDIIKLDFGSENNFDDIIEELFWKDLNFEVVDGLYIHDTNKDEWYSVESKYWYADFGNVLRSKEEVSFYKVNEDIAKELSEELYDE